MEPVNPDLQDGLLQAGPSYPLCFLDLRRSSLMILFSGKKLHGKLAKLKIQLCLVQEKAGGAFTGISKS